MIDSVGITTSLEEGVESCVVASLGSPHECCPSLPISTVLNTSDLTQ